MIQKCSFILYMVRGDECEICYIVCLRKRVQGSMMSKAPLSGRSQASFRNT